MLFHWPEILRFLMCLIAVENYPIVGLLMVFIFSSGLPKHLGYDYFKGDSLSWREILGDKITFSPLSADTKQKKKI